MNSKHITPGIALVIFLALTLYMAAPLSLAARQEAAATPTVAGTYTGAVSVDEPVGLGTLDLVLTVTGQDGALAGEVDAARTQVFLGGPSFTGSVTAGEGITPTIRIESETFTGVISGRTVQRSFVLSGEVLDGGDVLRGDYTETITGFTPKPLLVHGEFRLARPVRARVIEQNPGDDPATSTPTPTATATATATPTATSTPTATPTPTSEAPTATPTATATATPTATSTPPGGNTEPGGNEQQFIYLPGVARNAGPVNRAVVEGQQANLPEATATPMIDERSLYLPVVTR